MYGDRKTSFGRNGGTYVTIASEHNGETNGPDGYHKDTRRERSKREEGHEEAPEPERT